MSYNITNSVYFPKLLDIGRYAIYFIVWNIYKLHIIINSATISIMQISLSEERSRVEKRIS